MTRSHVVRKRNKTARPALPGPRYRGEGVQPLPITLDDLRRAPGRLLGLGDLITIGVIPSYEAYYKQARAGLFPRGKLLPSRMLSWEAQWILDWYDALPRAGEQPTCNQLLVGDY